jgi:hypothetical protein
MQFMTEGTDTAEGMENYPGPSSGPEPEEMPDREGSFLRKWHFEIKIATAFFTIIAGTLATGLIFAALILLVDYTDDAPGSTN